MPSNVRQSFLECAEACGPLLSSSETAAKWREPSALQDWSVGGLSAHLVRALTNVERFLDVPVEKGGEPVSAGAYYAAVVDSWDLDSQLHRDIRARSDEMAAGGHESIVDLFEAALERLQVRLLTEPADRLVTVLNELVMTLDDYLRTRIVELTLHADDVAVSIGAETPAFSEEIATIAIETMIETSRVRYGDLAILRALGRRERDQHDAARVF
ncbi:MAG TPA: maleylpyruvate isomerase N-terminal domain-containing protein [Actinomycetota bacterium]|nr:maleylpyruvate isomerase N-terminal domain-containing protein [Actinomycetota bacterium]